MRLRFSGIFLMIASCTILMVTSCTEDVQPMFVLKPSSETGITFNNFIQETDTFNILTEELIYNGAGVAVGDFNADGKQDVFFSGSKVANKLYLNQGDFKFKDVSAEAGVEAVDKWSTGAVIVDINNDGLLDLYVCASVKPNEKERENMLFVNQGINADGVPTFKEMAKAYGIADTGNCTAATFFDYDLDGDLDLYILNNVIIDEMGNAIPTNYRPRVLDGSALSNDRFYRNNGDGSFSDITMEAGITIEGFGLGVAVSDINMDGWPDVYISNDYMTNDILYINQKDGTFRNDIEKHVKHQSRFSMGSDISDFNNDGFLDIFTLDMLGDSNLRMKTTIGEHNYIYYVLNKRWDYEYQYIRNMLHLGNGPDAPYSEIGLMAGIYKTDWSWSPLVVDMDNDGNRDLLITNGFPRDITDRDFGDFRLKVGPFTSPSQILDSIPVVKIANYAYRNNGDLTFEDVSEKWGLSIPSFSNGAAYADLDNDGDLDYVVNNINEEAFVFENTLEPQPDKHFLRLQLQGPKNNPLGIGAKVVLRFPDNSIQYAENYITRGYMSSVEPILHFGLGSQDKVASVEVLWPDGKLEKLSKVKVDEVQTIDYKNAKVSEDGHLAFPFSPPKTKTLLTKKTDIDGLDFAHEEQDVIDYNLQRTLPHKLTQNGPCLAIGDLDGNGTEDFVVGSSSGYSPMAFFQNPDGTFEQRKLFSEAQDWAYEEEGIALFDLENDGDLDLYMVSGSNEFMPVGNKHTDRLFVNDGNGNFGLASNLIPTIDASGSTVVTADFDGDGYTDLFVGGRSPMGSYPYPDKSFLLKNDRGKLMDVTQQLAPDLSKAGMVTDAMWNDVDMDGRLDLIVVGEYMPVTIFKNHESGFKPLLETGLEDELGWWESISGADFDGDGDTDFIVGNIGANNFYKPSKENPVTVLGKDFDGNGSMDPIVFAYFKNNDGVLESFPVNFWGDMFQQSPIFRGKFNLYKEYGLATQADIFTEAEREGALKLIGNQDKSSYIENLGNGKFKLVPLPNEAQLAPINDMLITDVDHDNHLDVLLIGNDYGNETFIGRLDALNGLLLKGDGKGSFTAIPSRKSGFTASGDAKAMGQVKTTNGKTRYVVTQNRDSLLVFGE
ncbi:VCBS repeat-containing protein [Muricauda sp. MAR_2010_75]|uniref:VCBS repeat-containing protein n=1 Tax=Allomuricauda sp. MAR_2010_75 TaxID=1250232 RepID=UPI0006907B91|nr:VCBS repeat-containing protein [Muricauda sp. MAR_2010_75]